MKKRYFVSTNPKDFWEYKEVYIFDSIEEAKSKFISEQRNKNNVEIEMSERNEDNTSYKPICYFRNFESSLYERYFSGSDNNALFSMYESNLESCND